MVVGQALAYVLLVPIAQAGVDYAVPGQVAFRASLGFWGARTLSSPYRVVAGCYWFAAQALAAGLGFQAIVEAMTGTHLPLVPIALAIALVQASLGVLGLDVMRFLLRVVLPLSLAFTALIVVLYVRASDPRYGVDRVFRSPGHHLTWLGFATYVTVVCGSSLTLVTSAADFCRYTPRRRDMRIGLLASAVTSVVVTTFVGGYAAAATGTTNPFVAVADLTRSDAVLVVLLLAIVVQTTSANITNVYTAGLSLVNAAPRLGRLGATVAVGAAACALCSFPGLVHHAESWIVHLGNVAAPITGVILADFAWGKRGRLDVAALYDPDGAYRYTRGVNVAALVAVAVAVAVYYSVPQTWLKIVWGVGVGALAYLALARLAYALRAGSQPSIVET
jgi:cytosine/uracil/thiamine/allantoin permease